jgi:predicted nucleotidyltransferase
MIFVRPDRPVDPLTLDVLRVIDPLARELQIPYFVVGAMARDIVLTHVCGIETGEGTRDVDFALAVRDWNQFEQVKLGLIATGNFEQGVEAHRLKYHARPGTNGYPLDIIPFRGTELPGQVIAWPPELAVKMNVVGYEDAFNASVQVTIDAPLSVRVASLPGLALLKVFAWEDRGSANRKDARDLATLLRNYARAESDRLHGDEIKLYQALDYDDQRAGPRLLGRDVLGIASQHTLHRLRQLLNDERQAERLMVHMSAALSSHEHNVALAERLLQEFKIGLAGN